MASIRVLILGGLSLFAAASASLAADRIVFLRVAPTESTLYIADADGSDEQPLTQPGSMNYNPAWSVRGDWIAFTSDRAGSADLFRVHPDGTRLRRVSPHGNFCGSPKWLPDGKHLVADCMSAEETWDYRVRFYPGQQSQIFKVDIASGSPVDRHARSKV